MNAELERPEEKLANLRIPRAQEGPRRKRSAAVSIFVAIVVIGVASAIAYALYARTIGRPAMVQTTMVTTRMESQPAVLLTGSGYIVTRQKYITIGTKILGQIVAEPIEEGQHVKAGEVLARIDDRDYQAQLRQALANSDLAQANLRLNQAKAQRAKTLIKSGAISQDDYDTAMSGAEVSQAQVERDRAAVDYAKFNVNQCVITSPIDGIVLKKYREVGDTINFGGEIQAGGGATDIAQLADTTDMRAEVDINETDIARIAINSPATVMLDAYPDRPFEAMLIKVYPKADRQKGTVKIEVHIEKPDLQLIKPEMSVKVSFLVARKSSTDAARLTVPKSAIKTDGSKSFVWTVNDSIVRRVPVVLGQPLETDVEVKEGLRDGDRVIVAPDMALTEGQKVTVGRFDSSPRTAQ